MRRILRLIGLFGGLGLLIYGLLPSNIVQYFSGAAPYLEPRTSDAQWIAILWGAGLLLGLAAWATLPPLYNANTRVNVRPGVLNLALALSVLFVMLTLQLLRTEFIYAESIYNRTATIEATGAQIGNSRPVIRALRTQRGTIFDRTGVELASSRVVEGTNGLAQRTYPIAQIADVRAFSNLLGYSSATFGQSGLEAQWNDYLTGDQGQALQSLQDDLFNRAHRGNHLQLTIDWQLQARVWDILNRVGGGRPGSAIVLDPRTGAVLAMASNPGFDPQGLALNPAATDAEENARISAAWNAIIADENRPLINRPLQGQYVPGSTFKTLTAIGALEHPEALREPEPLACPDEYQPDPNAPPVVNAVREGLGPLIQQRTGRPIDLSGVYAFSCNTAFGQIGVQLGQERLTELAERFHIYRPQNAPDRSGDFTDLPMQPSYLTTSPDFLSYDLALADTAFGQGQLQITPMQMALIGATIANDGVMPKPYLVERVTAPDDPSVVLYQHTPPRDLLGSRRLISSDVADAMLSMMREGVTIGFGTAANVNNSGGKSGSGEAGEGIIHAAFLAVAPVDEPRYVVYVQIENGRDGAGVGALAAGEILRAAFEILQ